MDEHFFLFLAGIPVLGILAQWLAWRFRIPSILLLLGFGIALGQVVNPDALLASLAGSAGEAGSEAELLGPRLLFPIVSLSVAVILFEGGLTLRIHELQNAGRVVLRLVTVGALVSWALTGFAAYWIFGLSLGTSALLGAVLVVTGPTVVAPLLRHIRPTRRIGSVVKWEGIVIDPIGAVLAVLVFEEVFSGHGSEEHMVVIVLRTAIVGGLLGWLSALVIVQLFKRFWVPDFLHGVFVLAVAIGVFALSNHFSEESGLVTVTVLGIALANQKSISIRHIVEFKEHLGVMLISCLFIVLGSRINPQSILDLHWRGPVFLAVMILLVRPASVLLSTIRSELSWRERIFLAFLAPRGIVAAAVMSVFALKVASGAGEDSRVLEEASQLVPITFLVIVGTVAIYGLLAAPLARALKLSDNNPQGLIIAGAEYWVRELAKAVKSEGFSVLLVDTNHKHVTEANLAGLPATCASILSEYVREELDLAGVGRLLALTPSNEVNTLAAREFAHVFGRAQVYQLPPWDSGSGRRESVSEELRGRTLFARDATHGRLAYRMMAGAQVKCTRLGDKFTLDDFRARYPTALILFIVRDGKRLHIVTAEDTIEPKAGDTIIALVDPPADKKVPRGNG